MLQEKLVGEPSLAGEERQQRFLRTVVHRHPPSLAPRTELSVSRERRLGPGKVALIEQGALPIINENDTVATEEIRVGDNDNLSALVANVVEADMLALLTDQPGLFTADPRNNPNAKLVEEVTEPEIPTELWKAAGGNSTQLGTGGMVTKLQAADLARRSGTTVVIAHGSEPNVLSRLVDGERLGTRFAPLISALESRKPGERVQIDVRRAGANQSLDVELAPPQ